jgi:hypothetical protein
MTTELHIAIYRLRIFAPPRALAARIDPPIAVAALRRPRLTHLK